MKGFSLIPSETIRHSQLNSSTAKQACIFPRQQRFKSPPPNCPVAFYDHFGQLSKRKTSIGYGKKSDFTKSSVVSPASNSYEAQSIFHKDPKKGKTFGVSRQMSPENGIITKDILKFPGPGKYDLRKQKLSNIEYTMRPKTIDFIEKKLTWKNNPGPGNYEYPEAFPSDGKSYYSKFHNSKFAKMTNAARFQTMKDTPGPQTYDLRDEFSRQGKYIQSQHRGQGTRPFTHTLRIGFTDLYARNNIAPGPGLYQKPSQFGVYGDSKYYKTLTNFQSSTKHNQTIN